MTKIFSSRKICTPSADMKHFADPDPPTSGPDSNLLISAILQQVWRVHM